jgi:hypothetical protein
MNELKHKKIMTVSLSHSQRAKAYGIYDGNILVVTHIEPILGLFSFWEKKLQEEIQQKNKQGYTILVDEPTDRISRHALRIDLNKTVDSRSNFYHVLDAYFALYSTESIVTGDEIRKYLLKIGGEGSRLEVENDDQGRTKYHADWNALTGMHRALILQAYAVVYQPVDNHYIDAMFGALTKPKVELDPKSRWIKLMKDFDLERAQEFEEAVEKRNQ